MEREPARQEIRRNWRNLITGLTTPAQQKVNGETSWICPICGHGAHGDGLTRNPQSKDGSGLKCFGCGFAGDILDLYQKAKGIDHNTALQELAAASGITIYTDRRGEERIYIRKADQPQQEATSSPTEAPAEYGAYYAECRAQLADAADYLTSRGISLATAQAAGIGYDPAWKHPKAPKMQESPRLIIPIGPHNYLARYAGPGDYINYRGEIENKSKVTAAEGQSWIFNSKALAEAQAVILTEGEIDALSIAEAGGTAVALGSVANAAAFVRQLEQSKATPKVIVLALDTDPAGEQATDAIRAGLERLKIASVDMRSTICGSSKDPNEALQADATAFRRAVAEAQEGAATLIECMRELAQKEEQERRQRTGPEMIDSFLEAIRSRKYEPIPTGITDIDRALGGGFMRQWLVLLGAPPGAGKTALAQWIFEGMAKRGTTILYINLEMSRDQMLARSISRIAAQNGDKIKPVEVLQGYKWTVEQEEAVAIAAAEYRRDIAPHLIYNPQGEESSLDSIMEYIEAEATRAEAAALPAPLLVIDYLQVITGGPREDKTDLIQRAIGRLKGYAIAHNTCVFAIMANNRESNRTGITSMESGRDTSNIEYGADLLLGLDFTKCLPRDGQKGKSKDELTPEDMNYKTLKINKGRFTAPGTQVDLLFNGETMTFNQLATEFIDEPPQPTRRRI